MRGSYKSQIKPTSWSNRYNLQFLKNINDDQVIYLNDHVWFRQLNYVSYIFYHPYSVGNLKLHRLVVLFHKDKKPRKKKDWLDGIGRWPTSFRDGLTGGSMKNCGFKAKLLGDVQVYLEDFFRIVGYQCEGLAQDFLNA